MRAERLLPRAIGGRFAAPPSKSEAQRALLCAALADAPTHLVCPELSRDVAVMADGLRALGAAVGRTPDGFFVTPLTCAAARAALDCGDSGAALRFLLPLAAALGVRAELRRSARLAKRPVAPLAEVLRTHGCKITEQADGSLVCAGQLRGDRYTISGAVSSQFVSRGWARRSSGGCCRRSFRRITLHLPGRCRSASASAGRRESRSFSCPRDRAIARRARRFA